MDLDLTDLRTVRSFIVGTWNGGGTDQTYTSQDGYAVNPTRQYQVVGANGTVGVEGSPVSSAQGSSMAMPLLLAGLAVVAFLILRKG